MPAGKRAQRTTTKPKTKVRTRAKTNPRGVVQPKRTRSATDPRGVAQLPVVTSRSKTIQRAPMRKFEAGQWVLFSTMPAWVSRLPQQSQDVFAYCFGRKYKIEEITPDGLLVLDVSADVDHEFGGFMNDIRVEPECVVPAP